MTDTPIESMTRQELVAALTRATFEAQAARDAQSATLNRMGKLRQAILSIAARYPAAGSDLYRIADLMTTILGE